MENTFEIITKRYGHSLIEYQNKIYIFGGISSLKKIRIIFNDVLEFSLSILLFQKKIVKSFSITLLKTKYKEDIFMLVVDLGSILCHTVE